MSYFDEELRTLQQQTERKRRLEAVLREDYRRQRELRERVCQLEAALEAEQADVDRLENGSLSALFFSMMGRMEEKLEKERREALAARAKYEAAALELQTLEEDVRRKEEELSGLRDCRLRYEALLEQKAEELKRAGGETGRRLLELEKKQGWLESQYRELEEAEQAAREALNSAELVLDCLAGADDMATWDLFSDSAFADFAKHSRLDEAQRAVGQLQLQLQRLRGELADVTIYDNIDMDFGGFTWFADVFFDNIFTDWMVKDKIHRAADQTAAVRDQIIGLLSRLNDMMSETERDRQQTGEEYDRLVRETPN